MTDKCGAFNWKDEEGCPAGSHPEVCSHFQSPIFMCCLGKGIFELSKELFKTIQSILLHTPGMRSAMSFTLLILSTSCIRQRGKASLTAGWMCWAIFSRYKTTVTHPTSSVWGQIYTRVSFLQGGAPSPFDRNYGTKVGVRAIQWLSQKMTENFRQGRVLVKVHLHKTSADHGRVSRTSLLSLQTTSLPTRLTRRACWASAGKSSPSSLSLN